MTDRELDERLRAWYRAEIPGDLAAPAALRSQVAAIPQASPVRSRRSVSRRGITLLAAALLTTAIVGGALLSASGRLQSVVPPGKTSMGPSAELPSVLPSVVPSESPAPSALIAYVKYVPLESVGGDCISGETHWFDAQKPTGCSRLWVSNADGTGAHELLPDHPGYQTPIAWSPDGTRLLYKDATGLWLTDPTGIVLQSLPFEPVCGLVSECGGYAFSPDGAQLAVERMPLKPDPTTSDESVLAIVDLATGHVTELDSTYAATFEDTGLACGGGCGSGDNGPPRWSPDGTRLVFARQAIGFGGATLFMVGVDGTDLHQFVPIDLHAVEPRWSADGSVIVFVSDMDPRADIYVVRPDGTGLRALTTDGASVRPNWTADGRLVFAHAVGAPSAPTGYEVWVMDADGANKARLPATDAVHLTAANCLLCPNLHDPETDSPITEFMNYALWQPMP
jgi:Tol biopolymer transport system component